jgi:hypothetical protein
MDDDGATGVPGDGHLVQEGAALFGAVALVLIVVIEPHFAHGDNEGIGKELVAQGVLLVGPPLFGIMGVESGGNKSSAGVAAGELQGAPRVLSIGSDQDDAFHASLNSAEHDGIGIVGKLPVMNVGMGIDDGSAHGMGGTVSESFSDKDR